MPDEASSKNQFHNLPWSEMFLIWALRQWVETSRNGGEFHVMLREAFRLARIAEAYLPFDELLTVIKASAIEDITLGAPHCGSVTRDEWVFIGAIASLQRIEDEEYRRLLGLWLPAAGVRLAKPAAGRLARTLASSDLMLRRPVNIRTEQIPSEEQAQPAASGPPSPPAVH